MRTTIDLDYDTLVAAKEVARMENVSLGKVISRLVRQALTGGAAQQAGNVPAATATATATATGFVPFAPRGAVISNELIDRLRDAEGV
ncbi:MAG: hypothetical protein H3C29_03120 [Simplicispira suum]|uniref:hypothetical protein n=1 Tax=Simplicispira suum TaxID=2109915 RepID=UPI001C6BAB02|nr:hypothetical protein [Simplicispira suum]MBW7832183.1 hypothetical protein [Simplicispira suum]